MMRRLSSIASAAVLLLAISGAGAADSTAQSIASGTVVSTTGSALIIGNDVGELQSFVVDAASDVPATLTAGTKVTVEYKTLADGWKQATRVTEDKGHIWADTSALAGRASPLL